LPHPQGLLIIEVVCLPPNAGPMKRDRAGKLAVAASAVININRMIAASMGARKSGPQA
jgi:hypothetical protein